MLMRSWVQALCAAVCVLALTGCGDECVDQFDCRNKKGAPPEGKEWVCTDENKCEARDETDPGGDKECSPACATGEICDISGAQGVCRTCTATVGCAAPLFCDTAANGGKGLCKSCSDTATGNGTDQGCSATAPVCDTSASNGAGVCKACADSAQGNGTDVGCSDAAPVCDTAANNGAGVCKACTDTATGNGTDLGCADTAPVCDTAASNGAGVCKACLDSAQGDETDLGCADTAPVCDTTASNGAGACKACTDTATGNGTDLGCADTAPICNTSEANGAGVCRSCVDSAQGNDIDLGCVATAPVCNASAANGAGQCKSCIDSAQGNGTDLGCLNSAPLCDAAANNGAGTCKVCEDSASGNDTDLGCSATSPLCDPTANNGAGVCKSCVDSASGATTDLGCSAAAPLCDATAASGSGICKLCLDTAASGNTDLGCSTPTSLCDPSGNDGVGTCNVCVTSTNEGCPGSQTCNATGTACEGCADDTSCTNASTPICKPPPPVAVCVECINDSHCTALRPTCNTATNFCGCTSDATCAAAPGNTDFCDTAANNGRGECKVCVDSAQGNDTDTGCSASAPLCDASAANGAGVCKACVDSATGNGTDQGCSASAPVCDVTASNGAGVCKACVDSESGTTTDLGCSAAAPLCDASAANGSGSCKLCLDTAASGGADLGCSAPASLCDPAANNGVGTCNVCVTASNEGCSGFQTCNATGTACEGCADDASCTNASTPICKPPPPVSVCVECLNDAQCTATRPTCGTANNFCGCTTDAACAAAPGNTDFCDTVASNGNGECKVCVTDANCAALDPTRPRCDGQMACVQCRNNSDCSLSQVCDTSKTCVTPPGADPVTTSGQIQAFINAPVGTLSPPRTIENAFVTYIKPAVGDAAAGDVAGFFLQAQYNGPAMFVEADPSTLQVGDRITLTIAEKVEYSGRVRGGKNVSGLTIVARGYPVQNLYTATPAGLAVDVSTASDLVTGVDTYFGKILRVTGTMSGNFSGAGTAHLAVNFTTAGMPSGTLPRLRLPTTFVSQYELQDTCTFTLDVGPMWKFANATSTQAQPSAYGIGDFSALTCPAPKLNTARAVSSTEVWLTFNRKMLASSLQAADFTIGSLTVTAVSGDGSNVVKLTTTPQTTGQTYTVTVAGEVTDLLGTPVDATARTASFSGLGPPPPGPALVINEIDYDNVGTDNAEYFELYNRGGAAAPLSDVIVLLVNGDSPADSPTAQRKEYLRFPLSAVTDAGGNAVTSLAPGGYILAASAAYFASNPPPASVLRLVIANATGGGTDIVQNGTGDGIGLLQDSTGTLIDSVFYETATPPAALQNPVFRITTGAGEKLLNFVEGTRTTAADSNSAAGSLQRSPNGLDTNNNDADFLFLPATPGQPNP
ncbi:lamin tail domain-containing protein [Hyalangium gracile]|uniref:lamin tail domain-containing protein n=1 Tax=Hyalangium gracile TaxID=394092 RepID=UPI001CCACA69|nr:lamin tail domain-containing protein [Hyalangium gracile]